MVGDKTEAEILAERAEAIRARRAGLRELPLVELLLDLAARVTWPSEEAAEEFAVRAELVCGEVWKAVAEHGTQLDELTRWLERAEATEATETETPPDKTPPPADTSSKRTTGRK